MILGDKVRKSVQGPDGDVAYLRMSARLALPGVRNQGSSAALSTTDLVAQVRHEVRSLSEMDKRQLANVTGEGREVQVLGDDLVDLTAVDLKKGKGMTVGLLTWRA